MRHSPVVEDEFPKAVATGSRDGRGEPAWGTSPRSCPTEHDTAWFLSDSSSIVEAFPSFGVQLSFCRHWDCCTISSVSSCVAIRLYNFGLLPPDVRWPPFRSVPFNIDLKNAQQRKERLQFRDPGADMARAQYCKLTQILGAWTKMWVRVEVLS